MVPHDRSTYFVDPGAASVTITRISVNEAMAPNFGREDILHNLVVVNRIPIAWIQHGFYFGYQYLMEHLVDGNHHYEEHQAAYGEMMDVLSTQGEPLAYPPWDRWYYPSGDNWEWIRALQFAEMRQNIRSRESNHWLCIGEAPIVTLVVFGPCPPHTTDCTMVLPVTGMDDDQSMEGPVAGMGEELTVSAPCDVEEFSSMTLLGRPPLTTGPAVSHVELDIIMDHDILQGNVECYP